MLPSVLPFLALLPKLVILINDEVNVMRLWTLHPFWTPPIGLARKREGSVASILLVKIAITIRWSGANYSLPLKACKAGAGAVSSYSPPAHRKGAATLVQHTAYGQRPRKVGWFYLEKTRLRGGGYLVGGGYLAGTYSRGCGQDGAKLL